MVPSQLLQQPPATQAEIISLTTSGKVITAMTATGNPFAFGGINWWMYWQIKSHAISIQFLTGLKLVAADVNQSGTVTGGDALHVQKRA